MEDATDRIGTRVGYIRKKIRWMGLHYAKVDHPRVGIKLRLRAEEEAPDSTFSFSSCSATEDEAGLASTPPLATFDLDCP